MIHLITGYAGYEHIKSEDDGAFNAAFFGGGQYVMEMGNQFAASIIDNNTVRVLDGDGMMYGRYFRLAPNSHEDTIITTGTAGMNRIDLICVTYQKNEDDGTETTYLEVIKGTEASGQAVAPGYTNGNILNGAIFNQMPLYKVNINGVVLTSVEPLFDTIPTYKALAEKYAAEFQKTIDNAGITTYTHTTGAIAGTGVNGKFKATVTETLSSIKVNGTTYTVNCGGENEVELISGAWYTFVLDGTSVNFRAGGGLTNSKLALATAATGDTVSGKTFYSGDKELKTGTLADKSGATQSATASLDTTNSRVQMTVPATGKYSTTSKLYAAFSTIASLIGLTAAKIVKGNTILGIAGTGSYGATGKFTSVSNGLSTINVGFKPTTIILSYKYSGNTTTFVVFNSANSATFRVWAGTNYGTSQTNSMYNDTTPTSGYGCIEVTNTGFTFSGYYDTSGNQSIEYWCY